MCYVWFWEQTVSISLHKNNLLVFTTEMQYVNCVVPAKRVTTIRVKLHLQRGNRTDSYKWSVHNATALKKN